jgi:hypothetical protein
LGSSRLVRKGETSLDNPQRRCAGSLASSCSSTQNLMPSPALDLISGQLGGRPFLASCGDASEGRRFGCRLASER